MFIVIGMSLVATALAMHTAVSYVHVFNSTFIQIYHSIGRRSTRLEYEYMMRDGP